MFNISRQNELLKIIRKYLQHKATEAEIHFLEEHFNYFERNNGIIDELTEQERDALEKELLGKIRRNISKNRQVHAIYKTQWFKIAATVLVLCLIGTLTYLGFFQKKSLQTNTTVASTTVTDLTPGTEKARLVLADGSVIVLDTASTGLLALQSNARIEKRADGQLVYTVNGKPAELQYNTLNTPRGGQYHLRLPDGTEAWLNASSSIRFPVAFVNNERRVKITGEVYFEVAKDKSRPFRVASGDLVVEALGTSFNIMAYSDETSMITTLIEGSVKVQKGEKSAILSPGQQADINTEGSLQVLEGADIDQVVAWKNGWFEFNSTRLDEIMKQISRWYDVDVVFEGPVPDETFSGIVSRKSNVSQVLGIMEKSGVKFKVETDKITVLK